MFLIFKLIIPFVAFFINFCLCENKTNDDSYNLSKSKCSFEVLQRKTLVPALDGLVGVGWDNLMNVPLSMIYANSFSECRTTPDGDFLVPNHLQILPIKQIDLDRTAEYYEHFKDAFEQTTFSINVEAHGGALDGSWKIGGSFSSKYQRTKEKMVTEKSSMFHTKLNYHAYTLIAQPDSELHPSFKARLLAIDAALEKNLTRRARYIAETIIRDYGTHVLSKVEAGAKIEEEDYVESSVINLKDEFMSQYKMAMSGSFLKNIFGGSMGIEYSMDQKTNETLKKATKHSHIKTYGGPTVNRLLAETFAGAKGSEQIKFTVDDLVALNVHGMPLYDLISEHQLSQINPTRVDTIRLLLKNATELYYKKNLHPGCMTQTSPNFNYKANSDDGNCLKPFNNYTFGGLFQTCTPLSEVEGVMSNPKRCEGLVQSNGHTGGFTCPPDFEPIQIFDIVHQFPDWTEHVCHRLCHICWIVAKCCNTKCRDIVHQEKARIVSHWCKAKRGVSIPLNQGYMFGGLFTNTLPNPFTGGMSCPGHYQTIHLSFNVGVCLSRDYELDSMFEVKFAGFFSCQSAIKQCENGYSQHLMTVLDGCEIYYCIRSGTFDRIEDNLIQRPPFEDVTALTSNDTESSVYYYIDGQLVLKASFKEILTNVSNEMLKKNGGKQQIGVNALHEDRALNLWLTNTDAMIDKKLEEQYGATMNRSELILPTLAPPKLDSSNPFLHNSMPPQKPQIPSSSSSTSSFSSSSILILFVILMVVATITTGGIIYYKNKKRTRSYASLIEENNEFIQNYDNGNL